MTTNPNETLQAVNQACRDLCRAMESAQDQHGASSREAREAEAAYDLATECRARLERRFGW